MEVRTILLQNADEIQEYNSIIEEYGREEALMTGKITTAEPEPVYTLNSFLFSLSDLSTAWIIFDPERVINIKLHNGEMWSLEYTKETWNKLKEYLDEKN